MERIQAFFKVSFGTKVLLPVAACMALIVASTVWLLDKRLTKEFQMEAARTLAHADDSLKKAQAIRLQELSLRYMNLPRQPIFRAAFQYADQHDGAFPPTLRNLLDDLRGEQALDVIVYSTKEQHSVAFSKKDPTLPVNSFNKSITGAVNRALSGEEQVDVVAVDERLFYLVSVPAYGSGDQLLGVLTMGIEIGGKTASEWADFSQCQMALVSARGIIASTVSKPELNPQLTELFHRLQTKPAGAPAFLDVVLAGEHFFCSAGSFAAAHDASDRPGWLLLSSYEQSLRALQRTQKALLTIGAIGVLCSIAIISFLIRRTTRPLRELRDSAEAVGKGDFSCRVSVNSGDECGELAYVFNQMTENLQRSREQLEKAVETLKTTQANLIQSEKLSGIGEFVAGVAHELNNPLTSVMGFSELLGRAEASPQHKRHLEMIHKSALRCQKIVQSLLSFARRHAPERKLASINELVLNTLDFLSYQLRTSNIEATTDLDLSLPAAMVDPHQLQQVFLNIVNNARQAMEAHRGSGKIQVKTQRHGEMVHVVFKDDGPGISEQNLKKIFDPFFTTKEVGKGTGLGLSLCYGIVKEHGGSIQVRSREGDGATFIIELPLTTSPAPVSASPATPRATPEKPPAHSGKRILVIDDEEGILEVLKETLSESGYRVDTARDGESALDRASQNHYDLALCDWKMPGLNGEEVYEKLRSMNPALSDRMIFITGDVINEKTKSFLTARNKVCLSKPFSLGEFRAAVEKALQE
jgi:signal transduction histidine kinase/CheY-like chemotaxis protein